MFIFGELHRYIAFAKPLLGASGSNAPQLDSARGRMHIGEVLLVNSIFIGVGLTSHGDPRFPSTATRVNSEICV